MNPFKSIGHFFANIGKLVGKGVQAGVKAGLTDEVLNLAVFAAKEAAKEFTDNNEKREFVVKFLTSHKIPESIARLAVELAVRIIKQEGA
jgi:hypothetical protein